MLTGTSFCFPREVHLDSNEQFYSFLPLLVSKIVEGHFFTSFATGVIIVNDLPSDVPYPQYIRKPKSACIL